MRRRRLAIAVILTVASGCDNVSFGGASLELRSPSSRADSVVDRPPGEEAPETPRPDVAAPPAALFAGTRQGARATLAAVADLREGRLVPIPSAGTTADTSFVRRSLRTGTELVLFAEGARVGRMTVDQIGEDPLSCASRPVVSGVLEVVPTAPVVGRYLALPVAAARDRPYGSVEPIDHNYDQRVATLNMARAALPRVGAPFPPSVLNARKDVQAFELRGEPRASVAATFLYGDTLAVGRPFPNGYSLFVMGSADTASFETDLVWYRSVREEGKGAPRYFGHLDWDADGVDEVLLEVFGSENRWFAGLSRESGGWERSFEDSCVEGSAGR